MAGYKETTFKYNPKAFWTFDIDRINDNRSEVYDEIGNINPLIKHGNAISLERLSLNNLETSDQFAGSLNVDGKDAGNGNWDSNSGFECIDSADFAFPNDGQFTIEFMYYKSRPSTISNIDEPGYYSTVESPIINKGSVLNCKIIDPYYSSNEEFEFSMFGGDRVVNFTQSVYPIYNRINHIICVYEVKQTDTNSWDSYIKLYVNGRLVDTTVESHIDNLPVTDTTSSWFLGKMPSGVNPATDWNSELLTLDQISIYDYAFTTEQVSHKYRKTKLYNTLIKDDYPVQYWTFHDLNDNLDNTVYADVGDNGKLYYNQISDVHRYLSGPTNIPASKATDFTNTSMASIIKLDSYNRAVKIFNPSQDYTVDFWFKTGEGGRKILLTCTEETRTWQGLTIWINSNNDQYEDGRIEVYESLNQRIISRDVDPDNDQRYDWSDNNWHHLAVKRTSTHLYLYIDGIIQASGIFNRVSANRELQLHIFGGSPGSMATTGMISQMSIAQYALQEMQIRNRWLYTTRYKMSGYTLIQGNPIQATVRFYNHISGELVEEIQSDIETGLYTYYPETNRLLDVVSFIPENRTTRFRIHGPVKPAEYDDTLLG